MRRAEVELYLLRHADAGDPEAYRGPDAERPLSDKGRRQAERLGRHLHRIGFTPDSLRTSPRVRALDTARIVGHEIGAEVATDDRLAVGFGVHELAAILTDAGGERILLVGHDPDFSDLVVALTGADAPLRKGALARIDLSGRVAEGAGRLRWLLPPDLLPS